MNTEKILRRNKNKGYVFISVILMTVVLETLLGVTFVRQLQEQKLAEYNLMKLQTFYAAQAAVERGVYDLATNVANFSVDSFLTAQHPVTFSDNQTTANYTVTAGTAYQTSENGVTKQVREYQISGNATHPRNSLFMNFLKIPATTAVNETIAVKTSTLFQYMIFYTDDLEVVPGQLMTLSGKVHSNKDIYLGSNGSLLKVDTEYLKAVGAVHRGRKNVYDLTTGTVDIKVKGSSNYSPMTVSPLLDSTNSNWTTLSQSTWNGTVQDRSHNVPIVTPLGIPPITPGGFYDTKAGEGGLRLTKKTNGSIEVTCNGTRNDSIANNIISQDTFYDGREGTNVNVLTIKMDALNQSGGCTPSNGVIYATREDTTTSNPNGIRLSNGSTVPSNLTVVTNNPLYVKGDFNTVNKKSVALVSDSLNIQSKAWVDYVNNSKPLANRVAQETTVNAAFASGITISNPATGQYNGGFENYPRLLEKWSGIKLNITGAFISLWQSQFAKDPWAYGGYYEAPNRIWNYDSNLISNPPPFTPIIVELESKSWWQDAKESSFQ